MQQWTVAESSPTLNFSRNRRAVAHGGDRASGPPPTDASLVAVCRLRSPVTSFTIAVVTAESRPATRPLSLGFGVSAPTAVLSEGFGRRVVGSWGLYEDRQAADGRPPRSAIYSCGRLVGQFRPLRTGDLVSFYVNLTERWCDLVVNFGEFAHRFSFAANELPSYNPADYVMGVRLYSIMLLSYKL